MPDYFNIINDVIDLLKHKQLEKAELKTKEAVLTYRHADYTSRSMQLTQVNMTIFAIKKQLEQINSLIHSFPEHERVFVKANVQDVIEEYYLIDLTALRAQKRKLSKPR